jgi:hypothetical protein
VALIDEEDAVEGSRRVLPTNHSVIAFARLTRTGALITSAYHLDGDGRDAGRRTVSPGTGRQV